MSTRNRTRSGPSGPGALPDGFRLAADSAECQLSPDAYFFVVIHTDDNAVATLIAVPRSDLDGYSARGAATLGRVWQSRHDALARYYPDNLPAPEVDVLPRSLRSYAQLIPPLLAELVGPPIADFDDDRPPRVPALQWTADALRWSLSTANRRGGAEFDALAGVVARDYGMSSLGDNVRYVTVDECQLVGLLGAAAARIQARETVGGTYVQRRQTTGGRQPGGMLVPPEGGSWADRLVPATLLQTAQAAALRAAEVLPYDRLPRDLAEPLAASTWRRVCAADPVDLSGRLAEAERLVDVASVWGVPVTEAQRQRPESLCAALADSAARHTTNQRATLTRYRGVGPRDRLTDSEADILSDLGDAHPSGAFDRVDPALVPGVVLRAFRDAYDRDATNADAPLVQPAIRLVAEANARYNPSGDEVLERLGDQGDLFGIDTQAQLALAGLRMGLDIRPQDLASVGAAWTALSPLVVVDADAMDR
ncbi:hypothetical protein psal_cds_228 [Pandoravirus salinus]|uniref:Uncharacterized protein n=1 Tax=Pandoravirus salinus TaxID=1349410 RepID=S4VWF0_9VIRU|nr:hypothetical protein psal_cds_228 [Pandoravirus salinus]AGO83766.1 hypothetical protein psal_cds_228 [Pandoravirus salinus]